MARIYLRSLIASNLTRNSSGKKTRTLTKSTPLLLDILEPITRTRESRPTTMNRQRQPQYNELSDSSALSTYPIYQTQSAGYLAVRADLCSSNKYAGRYAENSDMALHTHGRLRNGEVARLERQEAAISNLSEVSRRTLPAFPKLKALLK
jgi:hypothetical protein